MQTITVNRLPVPTFGHAGVNHKEVTLPELAAASPVAAVPSGVAAAGSEGRLEISGDSADYARIDQTVSSPAVSEFSLTVPKNGQLNTAVYYGGCGGKTAVTVTVPDHGRVKLIEVFDCEEGQTVSSVNAELGDGASFELIAVYIGSGSTASEVKVSLNGRGAVFSSAIGYSLDNSSTLDLALTADHFGKKSLSDISVRGVLDGSSRKTFCGTIDFKHGSAGAKGAESEDVLLLDERARNKTVPLILCAEEDVEGSHGASVGRLDDEQVFYMQSRGFSYERVYKLMAEAKLMQVIGRIDDEQTYRRVLKRIGRNEDE